MTGEAAAALIALLSAREPTGSRLGTPVLDHAQPEFQELVGAGESAVAALTSILPAAPARSAAWIIAVLRTISDAESNSVVRATCERWSRQEPDDPWVLAVRGQCNLLGRSGTPDRPE